MYRWGIASMLTCAFTLPFAAVAVAADLPPATVGSAPVFNVKEELIGEKSADTKAEDRKEDTASPDGERVAWRDKHGDKWVVKLNGKTQGAEYEEVKWIVFSPDSQHLAYFGRRGKVWTAVRDGQEQKGQYPELGSVRFSPDSQHLAYTAKKDGKWRIVKDGLDGSLYEQVGAPHFSPQTQRLVYAAKRNKVWVMVDNGVEDKRELKNGYDFAGFTPQQEKAVFVGYTGQGIQIVIGDSEGPAFDAIALPLRFGKTDDDFAYAASHFKNPALKAQRALGRIVLGTKEGPEYEAAPVESTGMAWLRATGGGAMFLKGGIHPFFFARWHGVSSPRWSPDGEHITYSARRGDKEYVVVLDGEEGPPFEAVPCGPTFSPEGKLYYTGVEAGKFLVVVDGKRRSEFTWETDSWKNDNTCGDFAFFEGGHFAYVTEQGGEQYQKGETTRAKRRVFVDGQPGKEYDAKDLSQVRAQLAGGVFHTAYEVHQDGARDDASFVVLDGGEGKPSDQVFFGTSRFSGDGAVTYLARNGRKFMRVTLSR